MKKGAEQILKYKEITFEIERRWNAKGKGDTGNNWGDWNRLRITQTT
jgi:hypothetical protein